MAIQASLPVITKEAIPWTARVPDADVAVITGVTTSSSGEPGEATLPSPRAPVGTPAPCWITPDFLHPLALPAECLSTHDEDLTSGTKMESDSSESSRCEPDKVFPLPKISRM